MHLAFPYYFEQWPRGRWHIDADLMAATGVDRVRMAEFAWSILEPCPGHYDWSALDEAIAVFAARGILTILGTPTAAYPPWLHAANPDIHVVRADGRTMEYGMRQDACKRHPGYLAAATALVAAMAERYAGDSRVAAWQIDNELGNHGSVHCYCPVCEHAFHAWLTKRFSGNIGTLNTAWGTAFWSQVYRSFDEISVPRETPNPLHKEGQNPGLLLAFAEFSSDGQIEFLNNQIAAIKERDPGATVTHNLMGGFDGVDPFKLAEQLDVVSWDNYPYFSLRGRSEAPSSFAPALMYGLKRKPVWAMEQASGPGGWDLVMPTPEPGRMSLWAWQTVARGADLICFFRWRTARFGIEQFWYGILPHSGLPGRRFAEFQSFSANLRRLSDELDDTRLDIEAAILFDQASSWSLQFQPQAPLGFELKTLARTAGAAMDARGISYQAIRRCDDVAPYRLIIAPSLTVCDPATARRLEDYVTGGGLLVLGPRSGLKDDFNAIVEAPVPGHLKPLAGINAEEFDVFSAMPGLQLCLDLPGGGTAAAFCLAEILEPDAGVDILAVYGPGRWYSGRPAITLHRHGAGACLYLGTVLDAEGLASLLGSVLAMMGHQTPLLPKHAERVVRRRDGQGYCFYLNHGLDNAVFPAGRPGTDLLSGERMDGEIEVAPLAVRIVKEDAGGD
jgi:beta-galactosidase